MATETRIHPSKLRVERRAASEGKAAGSLLVGHAAVYDQWTTLYDGPFWRWREVIRPGAFDRAIREKQDVRSLFNHDPNYLLGRTASGTLRLSSDAIGLMTETDSPGTRTIEDLVVAPMERGDLDGMSFAFEVKAGDETERKSSKDGTVVVDRGGERVTMHFEGDTLVEEREILDCDLFDVSPVTYPAYGGTDLALRSLTGAAERAKLMDVPDAERRKLIPKAAVRAGWLALAAMRLRMAQQPH